MDTIAKLVLMAELEESHCELNHGPGTKGEDYPAADYIILPLGYRKNDGQEELDREYVVPVCFECALALTQNDWTLLYCLECSNNRWVSRKFAKNIYRHHTLWLKGCPDCINKFGGLYFNDMPSLGQKVAFVSNTGQFEDKITKG